MLLRIGESHPGQVEQAGKRLASGQGGHPGYGTERNG